MIQYYSVNIPHISLICKTRKATVETNSKQLEYIIAMDHIAIQTIFVLNVKWLYSLVVYSSLELSEP